MSGGELMEIKQVVYEPEYDRFIFETNLGDIRFTLEGLEGMTELCRQAKLSVFPNPLPRQMLIRFYHLHENRQ